MFYTILFMILDIKLDCEWKGPFSLFFFFFNKLEFQIHESFVGQSDLSMQVLFEKILTFD